MRQGVPHRLRDTLADAYCRGPTGLELEGGERVDGLTGCLILHRRRDTRKARIIATKP